MVQKGHGRKKDTKVESIIVNPLDEAASSRRSW
jgi:hypothetical protein